MGDNLSVGLTVSKRSEQHPEAAEATCLIGPHPHHSHIGVQHDVISNCATKLGLQRHCTSFSSHKMCCLNDTKICGRVAS